MHLSRTLSCIWLIMLVTMATSISSHAKDKNSIFTACGEDDFSEKGEILVFHQYLYNKTLYIVLQIHIKTDCKHYTFLYTNIQGFDILSLKQHLHYYTELQIPVKHQTMSASVGGDIWDNVFDINETKQVI